MNLIRILATVVVSCAAIGLSQEVIAAEFPSKPIRVIVPFAAGGSTDQVARLLAARVSSEIGAPVVVENRPGANGNIGAEAVAKADPDGYMLLHSTSALGYTAAFEQKVNYDLHKQLMSVSLLIDQPLLIMASKQLDVSSMKDIVEYGKAHPDSLDYGSSGTGNLTHLAMYVLLKSAGVAATHVPYKGGAGAFPDFIAGRIDLLADPINSARKYVDAGQVKALAVTSATRSPLFPDVPTASESLLPGFQMGAWQALMAPVGTPSAIIEKLNAAYKVALDDPAVKAQLESQGAEAIGSSPKFLEEFLEGHIAQWKQVVTSSGIALE